MGPDTLLAVLPGAALLFASLLPGDRGGALAALLAAVLLLVNLLAAGGSAGGAASLQTVLLLAFLAACPARPGPPGEGRDG